MPRKTSKRQERYIRAAAAGFNEAAARCRGKLDPAGGLPRGRARFNEAAARCRGKPTAGTKPSNETHCASMRPRPDAAENEGHPRRAIRVDLASMRPRPDAAENIVRNSEALVDAIRLQ